MAVDREAECADVKVAQCRPTQAERGLLAVVVLVGLYAGAQECELGAADMVVDGDDLLVGKLGWDEEIGGVKVSDLLDCDPAFFLKLTFQAVDGAFAIFESASGQLGIGLAANPLIAEQYLTCFYEQAITAYIEFIFDRGIGMLGVLIEGGFDRFKIR